MGHSNIRSTMEYIHVANRDIKIESPIDVLMKEKGMGKQKWSKYKKY